MSMEEGKGHSATSNNSKSSEKIFIDILNEVIQNFPSFSLKKSLTTEEIYGNGTFARRTDGSPTEIRADGGWLIYKNKVVGCFENKYQRNRPNACERGHKYSDYSSVLKFPFNHVIFNLEGPGFTYDGTHKNAKTMSGQTGAFAQILKIRGFTVFINENEESLRKLITNKLQEIKDYYEGSTDYVI